MYPDPKAIILNVLDIIGYEDDKKTYADTFMQLCRKQALIAAIQSLPRHQQEACSKELMQTSDEQEKSNILAKYITPRQYQHALQNAAQTLFSEFIKTLIPTLSPEQLTSLQTYLDALTQQQPPPS